MVKVVAVVDQQKNFPTCSIAFGKSGSGKTVKSRERAEWFFMLGFCVIYLYDWGRFEAVFMNFPNPYKFMWNTYRYRVMRKFGIDVNDTGKYTPRGYKTLCYVPFCSGMPSKLPSCFVPFRISFNDLNFEEFCVLLGDISGDNKDLLRMVWYSKSSKLSFREFVEQVISYALHGKLVVKLEDEEIVTNIGTGSFSSLVTSIQRLYDTGIICDKGDPLALDLSDIMRNNKVIHSFSMAFMDDVEISYLIYAYLLRKIRDLRKASPSRYPNLFMVVNEAHELCPSQIDHAGQSESIYYMKLLLSQPRDIGVWAYLDTQRFIRLEKTIRGGAYTYYAFKNDMEDIKEIAVRYGLTYSVINAIKNLEVGVCCTILDRADTPFYYPPPASMCKHVSDKNRDEFFNWWSVYSRRYPDKMGYNHFNFERPKRIFVLKKEMPKSEQKEVKRVDELMLSFYRFALWKFKESGEASTTTDIQRITGKSADYFGHVSRDNPLFEKLFKVDKVKRVKLFYPKEVVDPNALLLKNGGVMLKD